VGREKDIEAIRDELGRARLVTLLGPGGSGKTRLSQEAAERVVSTLPDGVWLAELAPVDKDADPAAVPEAVVTALGARETVLRGAGAEEMRAAADRHTGDPLVRLTEYCAPRRMLLLLDNCEHVVHAAARLTAQLLERCPGLTVLATSREPLGVPGEVLYPVEPLPEPVAVRLLAERGAAARPGFRAEDDPEAVAEICRRLDGLPLAVELAAARLRLLTPRQIADRLDDRFQLLTGGARTVLPRQQTLRAVVDWSWELLDAPERAVLRRLAVFAGGCDLGAAEAACGPGALDALGSLVDKSLVVAAPDGRGGMRYRLLETVAEYAAERLDEAGDRAAAERAHLVHFRELARTTDPLLRGPGQADAIATLTADYENLRTALRCAINGRDEQEALCLALSLCWYWQIHDLRHEARIWSRAVAELGPDPFAGAEPVPRVEALYERCTDAPPPMRPEVLAEARRGVHLIHVACMDMETNLWQTPEGRAKLRTITRTYRPGLPQTCRVPGNLWFYAAILTGDVTNLEDVLDENVRTCRALGYRWELAMTLQMRANLLANRSELAGDATRDADEALDIFHSLGDAWGTAEALAARAEARERTGDFAGAADDYRTAMAHTERLGARSQVSVLSVRLAGVLIELGEDELSETMLREAIAQGPRTGNEALPAGRLFLAMLLSRSDRVAEAREQMALLKESFHTGGFAVFEGFVAGVEAWLFMAEGRYEEGLARVREAMAKALEPVARMIVPQMPSIQLTIGALGYALVDGGARARQAACILGAAGALLPAAHVPNTMEREVTAKVETAARAVLGDEEYAAAYAEGGSLSLEEATALL
jgi:predicted ATPase